MDMALRTSTRNRIKPTVFTPSKYETFSLNKKKALRKKIDQCNRPVDVLLEYKHGNYILELSLAAYEMMKLAIEEYFENNDKYKVEGTNQKEQQGLCTRTSYSIKNRRSNKQHYRINLFHTTSRMEVNGHGLETFILHLQDMAEMMDRKGNYSQLNKLLESQIRKCMVNMQRDHGSKQQNISYKDTSMTETTTDTSGDTSLVLARKQPE